MAGSSNRRCDAEVGRPGAWRSCPRPGNAVTIVTTIGSVLHYCDRHVSHVDDPERKYHMPTVSVTYHKRKT